MKKITFAILLTVWLVPFAVLAQSQCNSTVAVTDTINAQPGITVIANSGSANFSINGPSSYQGSGWVWHESNAPAGSYTISWGPVSGCGAPVSETKALSAGGFVYFAGNYAPLNTSQTSANTGTILVKTNLTKPVNLTLIGPNPTDKAVLPGTSLTRTSVPIGTYTVIYGALTGYITPAQETKTLAAGGTLNFYGNYQPAGSTSPKPILPVPAPTPVKTPPVQPKELAPLTIKSLPPGATIYINDELAGTAPVTANIGVGVPNKIRCVINGFGEATYNFIFSNKSTSLICAIQPSSASSSQEIPPLPTQQQPPKQGFFARTLQALFSIFRNIFR